MKRKILVIGVAIFLLIISWSYTSVNQSSVTSTPVVIATPFESFETVEPSPPPPYYLEEFSTVDSLNYWQLYETGLTKGHTLVVTRENDHLIVDLDDKHVYVYHSYSIYEYENVEVKMRAVNLAQTSEIGLFCRMKLAEKQWYEFAVESSGLWYLMAVDDGAFNRLAKGGTQIPVQKGDRVEYRLRCVDNEITVFLNGIEIYNYRDNEYRFNKGSVGFSVASLNRLPVSVEIDSFQVSLP